MASIDSWWNGLVRDRAADVLELVLVSISDDYESIEIILKTINEWGADIFTVESWPARRAAPVSHREVVQALEVLIQQGYAQAYRLSTREPYATPVEFSEREADDLWYYLTPKGIATVDRLEYRTSDES